MYLVQYLGDLEIVGSSMMQTREDLASWQREVQRRLGQEAKFISELRAVVTLMTREDLASWQRERRLGQEAKFISELRTVVTVMT